MKAITRKDFIFRSVAGGLGMAIIGPRVLADPLADLAVVRGDDPSQATREAVMAIGGMERFVKPGATVLVKPNASFERTPEQAANTNPVVVGTIIAMCREAGAARVMVADHTLHDYERSFRLSGIAAATRSAGGELLLNSKDEFTRVDLGGRALGKWPVFRGALDADVIINVPVVKHHSLTRVSAGTKNLLGLCGGFRKLLHLRLNQNISDLAAFFKPGLTIADGYRILARNGPSGGNVGDTDLTRTIIAGSDMIAVDARAAMLLNCRGADIAHLRTAHKRGLGTYDLSDLNISEFAI
ncbi:MAG: DUF362 domain-containing protein [Fidelibacterota bacterium]|nr:MAG: DUF362 domain-containing protein [Candidatus Neomarinimicrobiota bacterium]